MSLRRHRARSPARLRTGSRALRLSVGGVGARALCTLGALLLFSACPVGFDDQAAPPLVLETGADALVRQRHLSAGEPCAAGGVQLESGADLDGDGALDDDEVQSSAALCHGADGQDGTNGLDGTDGLDGTNGLDGADGADGTNGLDGADGAQGPAGPTGSAGPIGPAGPPGPAGPAGTLARWRSAPESDVARCPHGGQRLEVGLDDDADGVLGDEEVADSFSLCNGAPGDAATTTLDSLGCLADESPVLRDVNGELSWRCEGFPTYSGVDFALSAQTCAAGLVAVGIASDGTLLCEASFDSLASLSCGGGQVLKYDAGTLGWICGDDTDTDTDTLADLSCADGEVPKSLAGVWSCGLDDDTDTDTDTLASLSCPDGQVAKRVSGAWSCAADVDTDTDTDTDTLADLTCLDGQIAKRSGGAWACGDDDTAVGDGVFTTTIVIPSTGTPVENGTRLKDALASLTSASATAPYLVKLEPGVYDVAAGMTSRAYVDIEGSGPNVTRIVGAAQYGTLHLVANSEVRDVTIESTGGGTDRIGVFADAGAPRLERVRIEVTGSASGTVIGVYLFGEVQPVLKDVEIDIHGSAPHCYGARIEGLLQRVYDVDVEISGCANVAVGVRGARADARLELRGLEVRIDDSPGSNGGLSWYGSSSRIERISVELRRSTGTGNSGGVSLTDADSELSEVRVRARTTGNLTGIHVGNSAVLGTALARDLNVDVESTDGVIGLSVHAFEARIASSQIRAVSSAYTVTGFSFWRGSGGGVAGLHGSTIVIGGTTAVRTGIEVRSAGAIVDVGQSSVGGDVAQGAQLGSNATLRVAGSRLPGSVLRDTGATFTCVNTYDASLAPRAECP